MPRAAGPTARLASTPCCGATAAASVAQGSSGLRGLAASPRRARTTDSRHGYPIAPNRLARNVEAAAPNQTWLADLTYIPTGEGWLYLAAILDMHTRKIVGWSMRESLHTEIALDALNMAVERQRPAPA